MTRLEIILASVIGIFLVSAAAIGWIYYKGETAGASKVVAADQKATITTQKRIDNAEAAAPRTPHAVSRSMRDGSF